MTWATTSDALKFWPDARTLTTQDLEFVLAAAQVACEAYAPALAEGAEVPESYTLAVVAQARSIFRSVSLSNQDGGVGPEGFALPVFPLDWAVQQLLRPKRPLGGVA